jgi:hypothetical protein
MGERPASCSISRGGGGRRKGRMEPEARRKVEATLERGGRLLLDARVMGSMKEWATGLGRGCGSGV